LVDALLGIDLQRRQDGIVDPTGIHVCLLCGRHLQNARRVSLAHKLRAIDLAGAHSHQHRVLVGADLLGCEAILSGSLEQFLFVGCVLLGHVRARVS